MNLQAWLDLLEHRHPQSIDMGLERCGEVYRRLGSPRPAKQVFTVAGTNGKGSTVAYIAAMVGGLGQRYGTYTSPHIFRFNERISIMGQPVSDEMLVRAFEQVEAERGDISLTYFEFTTLTGLLILQQAELDCAVLEVGLGGRLDTVNLVDADCAVITPIGLDHQEYLGPDLASIAAEKAGVIRPGIPVVCTQYEPPLPILEKAEQSGSAVYLRGRDYNLLKHPFDGEGHLQFTMEGTSISVPSPTMGGRHQHDNLAAALAALALFNPDYGHRSMEISDAISGCEVLGRLQRVSYTPEILLDVGHNELAAEAIAKYLVDTRRLDVTCVLAMLADKAVEDVALRLGDVCKRWWCAASPGTRGQSGETLARRVRSVLPNATILDFESLSDAMRDAVSTADSSETILVFGSFSTVVGASRWLQNSMQHDRPDTAKLSGGESG